MRPELERLHCIEQQLLRTPAAVPAEEWQLRQLMDGELQADAAAQQQLYHGLRVAGRRQLRQELRTLHERLYSGRWSWLRRLWPL